MKPKAFSMVVCKVGITRKVWVMNMLLDVQISHVTSDHSICND